MVSIARPERASATRLILALVCMSVMGIGSVAAASTKSEQPRSKSPSLTPVTWVLANPVMTLGHTDISTAEKQGYFKNNGVQFNLVTSPGTAAVIQDVASGSADMGQADTLSLDTALTKGVNNVTAVCSYVEDNIYSLVVKQGSGIKSAADLAGKTIGLTSEATGVYYNAKAMLADAGVSLSNVTFAVLGSEAAVINALANGTINAAADIDSYLPSYAQQGIAINDLQANGVFQWQWNVVVANKSFLQAHPAAVAGICKAIQEGQYIAVNNPQVAISDYVAEGNSISGLTNAQVLASIGARASNGYKTWTLGKNQWGWMNLSEMQPLANEYQTLGLFSAAPNVTSAYTNKLVPEMQFQATSIDPRYAALHVVASQITGVAVPGKRVAMVVLGSNFYGTPKVTSNAAGTVVRVRRATSSALSVWVTTRAGTGKGVHLLTIRFAQGQVAKIRYRVS